MKPFIQTIETFQSECVECLSNFKGSGPNLNIDEFYSANQQLLNNLNNGYYPKILLEKIWEKSGETQGLATILHKLRETRQTILSSCRDKFYTIFKNNDKQCYQPIWYYFPSLVKQIENNIFLPIPVHDDPTIGTTFTLIHHETLKPMPYLVSMLLELCQKSTLATSEKIAMACIGAGMNIKIQINSANTRCSINISWPRGNLRREGDAHRIMKWVHDLVETKFPILRLMLARN